MGKFGGSQNTRVQERSKQALPKKILLEPLNRLTKGVSYLGSEGILCVPLSSGEVSSAAGHVSSPSMFAPAENALNGKMQWSQRSTNIMMADTTHHSTCLCPSTQRMPHQDLEVRLPEPSGNCGRFSSGRPNFPLSRINVLNLPVQRHALQPILPLKRRPVQGGGFLSPTY